MLLTPSTACPQRQQVRSWAARWGARGLCAGVWRQQRPSAHGTCGVRGQPLIYTVQMEVMLQQPELVKITPAQTSYAQQSVHELQPLPPQSGAQTQPLLSHSVHPLPDTGKKGNWQQSQALCQCKFSPGPRALWWVHRHSRIRDIAAEKDRATPRQRLIKTQQRKARGAHQEDEGVSLVDKVVDIEEGKEDGARAQVVRGPNVPSNGTTCATLLKELGWDNLADQWLIGRSHAADKSD
ncbi:MAG: hypothetical protein FRX49_09909 [Trebouxia sp. A1-2]|nr:MAG: hypothetical protein FRX49_09909 [Trebouxia sp. A1-2]